MSTDFFSLSREELVEGLSKSLMAAMPYASRLIARREYWLLFDILQGSLGFMKGEAEVIERYPAEGEPAGPRFGEYVPFKERREKHREKLGDALLRGVDAAGQTTDSVLLDRVSKALTLAVSGKRLSPAEEEELAECCAAVHKLSCETDSPEWKKVSGGPIPF